MIAALAACSSSGATPSSGGSPHEITWLTARAESSFSVTTVKRIAEMYAKDHPGFSLKLITTPDRPSYLQKLETLAAANQLPELFDTDATPFAEKLRDKGVMVNVADLLTQLKDTDKFRQQALDYQKFSDGSLYMMPIEFDMEFFWYNKALMSKAQVSLPTKLEDFPAMCRALKASGATPIAVSGAEGWPLQRYLSFVPFRNSGNDYIQKLRTGATSMGSAPGSTGVDWITSLGAAGCFSKDFASKSYTDARDQFTQGQAAVYYIGTWEMPTLLNDANLGDGLRGNLDYFTLPMTNDATTKPDEFYFHSGIGLALNQANFDNSTKDFVKYLIDQYPALYGESGQFSPILGAAPAKPKYDSPLYAKLSKQVDQLGTTLVRPWDTMLDPTTNSRMQQSLPLVIQGTESPADFESKIDSVITENAPGYFGK